MIKKVLIFLIVSCSILFSQDFTGIRIYINPGHGGHDSNDRYISATGFWESEGNLTKGLHLKSMLDSYSATTKISRTTNNTSDDLGLSVISADANNFDADYFHSIHSNGYTGKSNYTLILFQGFDNAPTFSGAKEMGGYLATQINAAHRTTSKYNRGDADFYGTGAPYLGVLKGLTMPGTLSEGSFHDYIPESWRLRNESYCKHEAWAITKAFTDYFDLEDLSYGEIAGVLRDPYDIVDYYYINSTDSKKPLNFARVTLLPDNKLFLGDALNNGFFMFDKVPPGTYDLILEAEDYELDTIYNVTVTANKTTFVDRYLEPQPNYSAPVVNEFYPEETENVRLDSDIILEFNVKMDRVSVEQSFRLSPNLAGSFTWESNDRRMIYSPNDYLQGGTTYEATLNAFAKSAYDVFIEQPFIRTFSTRSSLSLVDTYPNQSATKISTTVIIIMSFDAPIDDFSLGGNVYFQDMNGTNIDLIINEVDYSGGKIIFEPHYPLEYNTSYQVKLLNGIKDIEGSNLASDTTIVFTTDSNIEDDGSILSNFEDINEWTQPSQDNGSVNLDFSETNFTISTKRKVEGENSGKLSYTFSDSIGMCRIIAAEAISNFNITNNYGIWVFGDLSNNNLQLWFQNEDSSMVQVNMEYVNWTGWKFMQVNLSDYPNASFNSIVIVKTVNGASTGQIFFDKMQTDLVTDIATEKMLDNDYILYQNYPNPFNPTTVISYSIPSSFAESQAKLSEKVNTSISNDNVVLKIYDILGREIATLVNRIQQAGNYQVEFDASNLTSGIYYYQLKFNGNQLTKKMLLLK